MRPYSPGSAKLRPALVQRIREELDADPTISKAALARRVGTSRQTLYRYLDAMAGELETAAHRREEIAERRAVTYLDLIERVAGTVSEIEEVICNLRKWPTAAIAGHVLRGYATLGRQQRLLGELMGKK